MMKDKIVEKLKSIEKEKGVEILFAVESGSRAWGFASPDSDYDIRFVYKHHVEWYLNLWESKDTIQFMTEDDLDGSGWDIKKALQLLAKSNGSFLGWLFSPIVYRADDDLLIKLKELAVQSFNPIAGFYHYDSMNKRYAEKLDDKDLTLKEFFYAIRTALSASWILKTGTIPPVAFVTLCDLLKESDKLLLKKLIKVKAESDEKAIVKVPKKLILLTKQIIKENQDKKHLVKKRTSVDKEKFKQLFLEIVQ